MTAALLLAAALAAAGPKGSPPRLPGSPLPSGPKAVGPAAPISPADYFEKALSGAPLPPPETPVEPLRADVTRLLGYMGQAGSASAMRRRVDAARLAGGIPKTDWLGRQVGVEPLKAELLGELGTLSKVLQRLQMGYGSMPLDHAVADLLYSMRVLAERAGSEESLVADLRWLWGTYGFVVE